MEHRGGGTSFLYILKSRAWFIKVCIFKVFKMSNGTTGHGVRRVGRLSNKTKTNTSDLFFPD